MGNELRAEAQADDRHADLLVAHGSARMEEENVVKSVSREIMKSAAATVHELLRRMT